MEYNFKEIKENGLLVYEYIRGSQAYGTSTSSSDTDTAGIFMEREEDLLGLGLELPEMVKDQRQDNVWFSFRKYMGLLLKANPNILESLYIPEKCILYEHPCMKILKDNRDVFISKLCFNPFLRYSLEQIKKARSLKKKIVCPMTGPKKSVLDFVYHSYKQGSRPVQDWLSEMGLDQRYCGLVNIPNMVGQYNMFYDWGAFLKEPPKGDEPWYNLWKETEEGKIPEPQGYKGIVNQDQTSCDVRLSSVRKGQKKILQVSYYKPGYEVYCKMYREWKDFEANHNEERFNLAKEKQYDRKNMAHSVRLLHMGIEIAQGKGVIIDRTGIDADWILKIRTGGVEYEEIMKYVEGKEKEMKEAMEKSTLPEEPDYAKINDLMIKTRKNFYESNSRI